MFVDVSGSRFSYLYNGKMLGSIRDPLCGDDTFRGNFVINRFRWPDFVRYFSILE